MDVPEAVRGELGLWHALDLVSDALVLVDEAWRILSWNRAAELVLGLTGGNVAQELPALLGLDDDHVAALVRQHVTLLSGVRATDTRGGRIVVDLRVSGGARHSLVVVTDRTERHESQLMLRDYHAQYRAVEELAATGAWQLHVPSRTIQLTEKAFDLLGLDPLDAEGTYDEVLAMVREDHRVPLADVIEAGLSEQVEGIEVALAINGAERWLRFQPGGDLENLEVVSGTVQDVTALRAALEQAERSNRELDRFASGIAHDLTAPLSAIAGFADALAEQDGLPEEARVLFLRRIRASATKAAEQISLLLAEARHRAAALESVDADEAMQWVERALQERIDECGTHLTWSDLGVVQARPGLLRQVLLNVVGNAVKYGRTGGRVVVSAGPREGWTEVVVADDGPGIPEDQRDAVFAAGQRLEATSHIDGSGLGLAAVRDAMGAMKGTVHVDESPLGGAAFVMRFQPSPQTTVQNRRTVVVKRDRG